jgi:hypothetical protein
MPNIGNTIMLQVMRGNETSAISISHRIDQKSKIYEA